MAQMRDGTPLPDDATPPHWPRGVRLISIDAFGRMGVDENTGELYWDGKPVEMRRRLDLTRSERWFALIVGAFTILGSIGAVAQGWAAAHQWACSTSIVQRGCPPPASR